jgi:signal transduction histidine kinase
MARNISVKVPVATLISSIENKIAEIDEAVANYPAVREQFDKDIELYKDKMAQAVSKFLKNNATKIGYNHDDLVRINTNYNGRLELTFDNEALGLPKRPTEPERPNQNKWYGRDHANQKDLLEKNLKILRMTTQEEVNASTYGAVMELL